MGFKNDSISEIFSIRANSAKDVLESDRFYNFVRDKVKEELSRGSKHAVIGSMDVAFRKEDAVFFEKSFAKLKQEFPELDHFRISNLEQYITIDTRPNNLLGRVASALAPLVAVHRA